MKRLSIILLGTQMAVGGAQKLLLEQALWFHSHGHRVTVLFFYDRDNLHEKWTKTYPFEIQNLEAFDKKAGGLRSLPKLLSGLMKLWRILIAVCLRRFNCLGPKSALIAPLGRLTNFCMA